MYNFRHLKRLIPFFLFTVPAVLLYIIFIIYPLANGLYYSLTDWNGVSRTYNFVGLGNYFDVFKSNRSVMIILRTIIYALVLTAVCTVLSVILAILLNPKRRGQSFFRFVFFFPAVCSSITIGLIFNQVFSNLLPSIGKAMGIKFLSASLLSSSKTAMAAILLINAWKEVAIPTVLAIAGLQTIPEEIIESAKIDGATSRQTFWKVTLPLLMPTISIIIILIFRDGLMVFDYIQATTGGGPGFSTMSIAVQIYQHAFSEMKFAYSSAESTLVFILISLIAVVQLKITKMKD
jgi:raffinose/stachyose/melibiose transport system permease protein